MIKKQAYTVELRGTNYEIGWGFGEFTKENPALRAFHTAGFDHFDEAEAKKSPNCSTAGVQALPRNCGDLPMRWRPSRRKSSITP